MPIPETLSSLVLKGSAELGATLINAYAKRVLENNQEKVSRLKSNITPHIEATFNKCSVVKTLLNPHTPANFLAIYATQRFNVIEKQFDHYGMVEYIRNRARNLVLTGTGGSGKSMFTRYLWLSMFVHSDGKIPLFVELRNINNISMENIVSYIHYSISQGQASLAERDYHGHLKNGDFILILDGFDELLQNKKGAIQNQIIQLAENYPNLKIIVTSRPDERFSSWHSFEVAVVAPLHREDVFELIEKAEFSEDSKASFLKRLKSTDLFDTHSSFLTNPLLVSMMLLTFSHNFDIPGRMHLFYQQSFDALYQRHDSYKPGGFKRQFRTSLSEDVFKRIISYFCLITYYDEDFAFARDEAIAALEKSIPLAGATASPSDLLDDLVSCVCFLIVDGLQYTFSHRSFQEYFAACCMSYVKPDAFEQLVWKFSKRPDDQVITLLADMNPEALRRHYVLPTAERFAKEIQVGSKQKSVALFYQHTGLRFDLRYVNGSSKAKKPNKTHVILTGGNDFLTFVHLVEELYWKENYKVANVTTRTRNERRKKDERAVDLIFKALGAEKTKVVSILARQGKFGYVVSDALRSRRAMKDANIITDPELDSIFEGSYMYEYLTNKMSIVAKYVLGQRALEHSVSDAMKDLFGIG